MSKHLQTDMERLKRHILSMGAIVEKAVSMAIKSLKDHDPVLARQVLDGDHDIDVKEVEVEEECLKILALHQPVAEDLRFITAVLKTNNDLERMADLAANVAERTIDLVALAPLPLPAPFAPMTEATLQMVRGSLNAFVHRDPDLAREICKQDDRVDEFNREIITEIVASMKEHQDLIRSNLHFFSASRYLERIADHATNIAEDVVYMVEGEIIRHGAEGS